MNEQPRRSGDRLQLDDDELLARIAELIDIPQPRQPVEGSATFADPVGNSDHSVVSRESTPRIDEGVRSITDRRNAALAPSVPPAQRQGPWQRNRLWMITAITATAAAVVLSVIALQMLLPPRLPADVAQFQTSERPVENMGGNDTKNRSVTLVVPPRSFGTGTANEVGWLSTIEIVGESVTVWPSQNQDSPRVQRDREYPIRGNPFIRAVAQSKTILILVTDRPSAKAVDRILHEKLKVVAKDPAGLVPQLQSLLAAQGIRLFAFSKHDLLPVNP